MKRIFPMIVLLGGPVMGMAADDLKISQLEQDLRNLQREVSRQSQQIEELRSQRTQSGDRLTVPPSPPRAPATGSWLDASRWKQVKAGMSELEVIGLLGAPTSMRVVDEERVLLYAMEIGASGFLSGNVTLRDRLVTSVKMPVLQ